jgi:hypothetical protein
VVTPSLALGLKGLKVRVGHKSLTRIALACASSSSHSGVKSRSSDRLSNQRIDSINRGRSVFAQSVSPLVRSHSCWSRSRSKSMGLNKLKQGGHTIVDNWPWPGGHSTWSSQPYSWSVTSVSLWRSKDCDEM